MRVLQQAERSAGKLSFCTVILLFLLFQFPSMAVAGGLDFATGSKDTPIQIVADNGIEWQKDNEILISSGNAQASRDGVKVVAE